MIITDTTMNNLIVHEGATLRADALVKVGFLYAHEGATMHADALVKVSGDLYVQKGATLHADALVKVSGELHVQKGATLHAPNLAPDTEIFREIANDGNYALCRSAKGRYVAGCRGLSRAVVSGRSNWPLGMPK